jgi:mannosyltransferase OCH1-like enzyme
MPDEYERYGESWRRHHPDWELRLWTDAELPELRFPEAFEKARNFGERSDLLRYEILAREGGVYVDTDVECKQPIDPLLDGVAAFAGWVRPQKVGNAIIGAVPGHPAIERMLEEAQARAGSGHVSGATGPRLLTEVLTSSEGVTIFDREVFYPFHPRRSPEGDVDHPGAYAIHHVEASWKTSEQLREDIRKLRNRLESTHARAQHAKEKSRALRERVRRVEDRGRKLDEAVGRDRRRLSAIERSRWWRLRRALGRALRPLRAARAKLRSGRGRS